MSTWFYPRCRIVEVHDADTTKIDIDLGQDMWVLDRGLRLGGIACRELRDPGGIEARDYVRSILYPGDWVRVTSTGWDKYAGRIDGMITLPNGQDLGQLLIAARFAVPWDGRGAQPKPPWPR